MTEADIGKWLGSAVPAPDECVLGRLLERQARWRPDSSFAVFEDGRSWTYRDAWVAANAMARYLQNLGVRHGDRVLSWLPNGPDALRVWFGANLLGAIYVPLNTAYRGGILEHALRLPQSQILVTVPQLAQRLDSISVQPGLRVIDVGEVPETGDTAVVPDKPVSPWDPYRIIFTSGTTGPSKGVLCSYVQVAASAGVAFAGQLAAADRYLLSLPLFHNAGTIGTYAAILYGASLAIVDGFDTASFWRTVRCRVRPTRPC